MKNLQLATLIIAANVIFFEIQHLAAKKTAVGSYSKVGTMNETNTLNTEAKANLHYLASEMNVSGQPTTSGRLKCY